MDVRWSHAVASLCLHHAADGPIEGDVIAQRSHGAQQIPSLGVSIENAAAVHRAGVGLDVVAAVRGRLPYRELRPRQRLTLGAGDATEQDDLLALSTPGDLCAGLELRGVLAEEGSEQGGAGRL